MQKGEAHYLWFHRAKHKCRSEDEADLASSMKEPNNDQ